jgi:hypothetical protein
MTKDELKQKLLEVAEFKMPKLNASEIKISKQRARGKGRPSHEDQYEQEHEQVFLDMFQGINPTHAPELVKVLIKPVDCEDCGRHCENGRKMEIKFYHAQPRHIAHRRTRCLVCNKYKDPYTGEFTLPQGPASQVFLNWASGENTAKYNKRLQQVKQESSQQDLCVITKYPDTMNRNK